MGCEQPVDAGAVVNVHVKCGSGKGHKHLAAAVLDDERAQRALLLLAQEVEGRAVRLWDRSVDERECGDVLRKSLGDAGDYSTAVGVAAEDDVSELFPAQHIDDVLYMQTAINVQMSEMRAFTESRQGRGKDAMALRPQHLRDSVVTPSAVEAPVHEDEGRAHKISGVHPNHKPWCMSPLIADLDCDVARLLLGGEIHIEVIDDDHPVREVFANEVRGPMTVG